MPRGDRTGPAGLGPMSGRALGPCAGYDVRGYMEPLLGRGFRGCGRGRGGGNGGGGFGWRNRFYATGLPGWQRPEALYPSRGRPWPNVAPAASPIAREQELEALKGQAEYLEQTLEDIRKRVEELQAQGTKD
jgi:hypothetical protein